jgi:hypothetical protein
MALSIRTGSATTLGMFLLFILSTNARGKERSFPKRIPIFFIIGFWFLLRKTKPFSNVFFRIVKNKKATSLFGN